MRWWPWCFSTTRKSCKQEPRAQGCSERILTQLRVEGYEIVPTYGDADVVVVCYGITSRIARRAIQLARDKGLKLTLTVVAYDNGPSGILVGSPHGGGNGYDGVVIENCLAFRNGGAGIEINGWHQGGWRDGIVRNCTAWSNAGMGGIYVCSGRHILIENCRASEL